MIIGVAKPDLIGDTKKKNVNYVVLFRLILVNWMLTTKTEIIKIINQITFKRFALIVID